MYFHFCSQEFQAQTGNNLSLAKNGRMSICDHYNYSLVPPNRASLVEMHHSEDLSTCLELENTQELGRRPAQAFWPGWTCHIQFLILDSCRQSQGILVSSVASQDLLESAQPTEQSQLPTRLSSDFTPHEFRRCMLPHSYPPARIISREPSFC